MKYVLLSISLLVSTSLGASTELDGLSLNGMAVFSELKRPVYLAGLYLESAQSDAQLIIDSDEGKAMELTVTAERWSSRRFSEQMSKALLINTDIEVLKQYDVQVIEFTGVIKDSLEQGDKVIIRRGKKGETIVYVNGTRMLKLDKPGFFEMVLGVWIGNRPPSSDFKAKLLSRRTDPQMMDLYATLGPSPERVEEVAAWLEPSDKNDKPVAVVAKTSLPAAAPVIATSSIAVAAPEITRAAPEVNPKTVEISKPEKAGQDVTAKIEALAKVQEDGDSEADNEFLEAEQNKLLELYQHMVVKGILAKVKYPSVAVKRNLQGTAMLELTVNRKGEIVSVVFLEKTPHKRLNKAAEEAVAEVGQFPAVPEALKGNEVSVKLPVKFILS